MAAKMTPEEEGSDVREMVWEMSRTTNRILILGIILILASWLRSFISAFSHFPS
ncbi:MAG: hypothetical protein ACYDHX_07475 [Methanothrix sp.]